MKAGIVLGLGALLVAALAVAATPVQDAKAKARGGDKPGAGKPDEAAMQEAWIRAAAPGKEHAEMAKTVGTWKVTGKHWMDPTAPATESTGSTTFEMLLGGRFLHEHHTGDMGPMGAFEGYGTLAFNNITGEYEHVWMDSMGTGIMRTTGKPAPDGNVTFTGEMDDPMSKGKIPVRILSRKLSDNERYMEMHMTKAGEEMKCMELVYTRVSGR